jgi:PEP-CTERM motif-containing protein
MTTKGTLGFSLLALSALSPSALADTLTLYNWGFNVDGTLYDKPNPLPSTPPVSFNTGGFNFSEGLGSLTLVVAGPPSSHFVDVYFDHDLIAASPSTDFAAAVGALPTGESWEIGAGSAANLFAAFSANTYSDTNNLPGPGDVATGLGLAFTTTSADPWGLVTITVRETAPTSGFYLHQYNTSGSTPTDIYISATETNTATPEPSTFLLFSAGLCGIGMLRRGRSGR